ncbi:TIGR02270 family protein [Variovorax sp. J22R133]|uniref:TIGR02270 family protein n=1 Tax=Variovorax brevis TaxID=3053503 RepID=UPI0025783920|nr:TIGR02270 family protein [Variovorax sp. J22R133]MDM0112272.1 TIGR02270 family protein [Variovorax sp. J22R133]
MDTVASPVIRVFIDQHLEDAAFLRAMRSLLVRAPHITLTQLLRADERLAAHLDGLSISGDYGAGLSETALDVPGVGQLFVAAVLAIQRRDAAQIERLLSLLDVVPNAARALSSAFGWVSPALLRGLIAPLLASESPAVRCLGLAACAQHRVDPGAALSAAIEQPHTGLRIRALRAAGDLGRIDFLPACLDHLRDNGSALALPAAWSAALLGDRRNAVNTLRALALQPGLTQLEALALALFAADADAARTLVKQLAAQGASLRTLIKAAGWAGDTQVVPWLFKHMEGDIYARLAGEAFSFITGVDLASRDLERKPPETVPGGPNDDPNDDNVALDEDDSLPWPDLTKLSAWWINNASQFPAGTRLFAGAPPTMSHCLQVLREHTQRRRKAAAIYMSLLKPGTALFNVAAPSRRQKRLLAQMGA